MIRWRTTVVVASALSAVVTLVAVVGRRLTEDWYVVPTRDMEPAIPRGSRVLVERVEGPFAYGDVVAFIDPEGGSKEMVKRVAGLPGDEVLWRRPLLYRNGVIAREFEAMTDLGFPGPAWIQEAGPIHVPERHLFLLGDNPDHSLDSRYWGPVPITHIFGRVTEVRRRQEITEVFPWVADIGGVAEDDIGIIRAKYAALASELDERARRIWAATQARAFGRGGIALVSRATGRSSRARRDRSTKVSEGQEAVEEADGFHGDWNYTIVP